MIGEYPCKVDAKGRVRLPNGLLKGLGAVKGESVEFVINRGLEKCLVLYPLDSWEQYSGKVASLNGFKSEYRAFQRYFFQGAFSLSLDAMERINIPKSLMEWAGI
ncbi:MAG: division/cell wall cluster transcriptional repressor MraZ, partial [Bacteroidetes bacterium]